MPSCISFLVFGVWLVLSILAPAEAQEADALKRARELNSEVLRHVNVEKQVGQFGKERSRTAYVQAGNRLAIYDNLARLLLKLHEQDSTKACG